MASINTNIIERDYVDNFSIKELATKHIMPKYFTTEECSNLTVGTMGMLTEYLSNITEDTFNTGSSLVAEAFATRARMESSIYANAAVFQLTNIFAKAGTCNFVLIIPEADVQNNFVRKENSEYSYFYIGKDLQFNVDNIPFVLDYDIEIRAMYRETEKGWVYSAKYLMDDFKNSVSDKHDPYIRLIKTKPGLIAMNISMKQYTRTVVYESIIDNATLNYPTIKVDFTGKLLGFDVLYKAPGDTGFNTQLQTRVMYSLPLKEPFCYFKSLNSQAIEISFTTKDAYFQPEFNSELQIILYTTLGEDGNFKSYEGNNNQILKDESYEYENTWLITGKSIGACTGGAERMDNDSLQRLTVEGYSTANALTTEHDLQIHFNNNKHRSGNEVCFIKKRNDIIELLFSAFMYIKKDDYIFPTNTLVMNTNVQLFDHKDGGYYNLDPGFLFGYKGVEVFFEPVWYIIVGSNGDKYDEDGHYYDALGNPNPLLDATVDMLEKKMQVGFVERTERRYWRNFVEGDTPYMLFGEDHSEVKGVPRRSDLDILTAFKNGEIRFGYIYGLDKTVDFLVDYEKEIEAKLNYINYYDEYRANADALDITFSEYLFRYTFKDYKKEYGIDTRRTVFNTDVETFAPSVDFMFTNPFIMTVSKDTGLVSYYQSFISQDVSLDFVTENDDDAFVQFIIYTLHVNRDISDEKKYKIKFTALPSVTPEEGETYCDIIYDESKPELFILHENSKPKLTNFNKDNLKANKLRFIISFTDESGLEIGYMEMIPTGCDEETGQVTFEAEIYTDDYITSSNNLRIIHECPYCGHKILNSANANIPNRKYFCDKCGKQFSEGIINIMQDDNIMIPISGCVVKITALYNPDDIEEITDNDFAFYEEENYQGYIWTNIYKTDTNRLTFMKPLDMIRSTITYKDYYLAGNDAFDCLIEDVPLLKYSILAYKDEGMKITDPLLSDDIGKFQYFMDAFLDNYEVISAERNYMNGPNIDIKFYNTYGRSTNFVIGEREEPIDTNNISISFEVWINSSIDPLEADSELKSFIKNYIETLNDDGTNNLYISNLIKAIESNFAYVHHLKFVGINGYSTDYQSIVNKSIKLESLTKEERRAFVPDILVVNPNNVNILMHQEDA